MVGESFAYSCGGGLVTKLCRTLGTPWTVAHQARLSVGFSRQEYWNGLPFLFQRIFTTKRLNLSLLHWQVDYVPLSYLGSQMG